MTGIEKQIFTGAELSRIFLLGSFAVFFIFAAHYLQLNRAGVGLELPFNVMGWIPLSVAIGTGLLVIAKREAFRFTDLSARLAVLVCLLILPFFLPQANQDASLDRMLGLLGGLLLFTGLYQCKFEEDQKLLLLLLVVIAVWVEMIIGWDRFLRSIGIGISETRPAWEGPPHGVFQQRNLLASFVATGIVLSGYILGYSGQLHGRKFQTYYPVLLLLPLAGIHLLNAVFSRTGWLGTGLGVILVLPYLWRNARKVISACWLLSIVGGLLLTWTLSKATDWDAPDREMVTVESLRQVHFPQTIEMVLAKPVLGYGYGRFEKSYLQFTADRYAQGLSDQPGISRLDHPHNELLFWAVEGGGYALVILLLAAWFVFRRLLALPVPHRLAMIGVFFPIVLHTQVEYPFYQSLLHWIVFIVFIFWTDQLTAANREQPVKSTLLPGISGVLIPVLTIPFMVTTLHAGYLFTRFESGTDPNVESLARIINPAAYNDRINWSIMSRLVLTAAINNTPELARPYIEWAPELLERKPRPNFYRFLVLAYKVTGDEENMRRVQEEAQYLFPGESFAAPDLESGLVAPVPFDAISR